MRGRILLFFFTFCSALSANTYYVQDPAYNRNASNSNSGKDINFPWATLGYSINQVVAGDTLFVRGGVYYLTTQLRFDFTNDGTDVNPIVMMNYPGENPIIDCDRLKAQSGIVMNNVNYWTIQGIEQRFARQDGSTTATVGFSVNNCTSIHLKYIKVHDNGGYGMDLRMCNEMYIRGVDTYNNCDSLNTNPAYNGGKGDGNGCMNYSTGADTTAWGAYYFDKCRSWNNSDDGFGIGYQAYVYLDSCWSWGNGSPLYAQGAGRGFSTGHAFYPQTVSPQIVLTNCIAVYNKGTGYYHNCNGENYSTTQAWYNNISAFNGGYGFNGRTNDNPPSENIYWRNNIAFKNGNLAFTHEGTASAPSYLIRDHNSWDSGVALTEADFISLDTTGISAPRQANGSFPDNNCYKYFMRLSSTSDLIDAGINVGLPFTGKAPDIGPFEYYGIVPNERLVTSIIVTGVGGVKIITTNKGTLQLFASVLPADASNRDITWSVTNGTGQATISATGLVTAISNGTVTARATANDGSAVFGALIITISNQNQNVPVTGITVSGAGGSATIATDNGILQLSVSIAPANATNKTVTWSVTNGTGQATISATGLVTAISNGTVTARATANDGSAVYGTLIITISNQNQNVTVTGITVSGAGGSATIATDNGILQLSVSIAPANATNKTVTWSVTNGTGQATISATGLVTAISNGTVTARATANDGSAVNGTLIITISNQNQNVPVTGITVSGAGGSAIIATDNGTLQLSVSLAPANATNKTVIWSVTNGTGQATISATGLLTAIANGTVTARATATDGSNVQGSIVITLSNQKEETADNESPEIIVSYLSNSYSGFVNEINASNSYDADNDNLTYTWLVPDKVTVSAKSGPIIRYLGPIVNSPQSYEFVLSVSDGKVTKTNIIPVTILPYRPELEEAEILNIEASSFKSPNYPSNTIDGNIGTMWMAEGENQWLIIEFKHPQSVHHIKLAFQPGQRKESYFDILGSTDKVNWEPILTKSASCAFSGDLQVFEFPPSKKGAEFNYVKLIGLGNSKDSWNYISELRIFGYRFYNNPDYENLSVKIYPNPAKEFVTIRIDDSEIKPDFVQVISLSGVVVLRSEVDPDITEVSLPIHIKQGTYILQLGSGGITHFTQKLIVRN